MSYIVPENQMPNIMEVSDREGGSNSSLPSIEELKASQARGNVGKGLNEKTFNEDLADFNMGVSITED